MKSFQGRAYNNLSIINTEKIEGLIKHKTNFKFFKFPPFFKLNK